jgi:CRISPR system Cascade subunit CasD
MEFLLLRFDAPLQSFGGALVDQNGPTLPFPGRAMITGLLANALGWSRGEFERHQSLQSRLRYAVRQDREGSVFTDYQTVDLGQSYMSEGGWTTHGLRAERRGGNSKGTHIRFRDFIADAVFTLALWLEPAHEAPTLEALEHALRRPARPLFLGRKACAPAAPLLLPRAPGAPARIEAHSWREALASAPRLSLASGRERLLRDGDEEARAFWPEIDPGHHAGTRLWPVFDDRDWSNQVHTGRRLVREGRVRLAPREGEVSP